MPFTPAAQSVMATMAALKEFNDRKAQQQPAGKPQAAGTGDRQEPVEGGEIDVESTGSRTGGKPTPMGD